MNGQYWMYAINANTLSSEGRVRPRGKQPHWMEVNDEKKGQPVRSPNGKYIAYVKDCNIYIRELSTGKEKQLSFDGTPGNYYSVYIKWSPDSKAVASCIM